LNAGESTELNLRREAETDLSDSTEGKVRESTLWEVCGFTYINLSENTYKNKLCIVSIFLAIYIGLRDSVDSGARDRARPHPIGDKIARKREFLMFKSYRTQDQVKVLGWFDLTERNAKGEVIKTEEQVLKENGTTLDAFLSEVRKDVARKAKAKAIVPWLEELHGETLREALERMESLLQGTRPTWFAPYYPRGEKDAPRNATAGYAVENADQIQIGNPFLDNSCDTRAQDAKVTACVWIAYDGKKMKVPFHRLSFA